MTSHENHDVTRRLGSLPLTYPEVGATAGTRPPSGYGAVQRSLVLGSGPAVFERAGTGLMSWQMHRRAGLDLIADSPTVVTGGCVLLIVGRLPIAVTAPCRVVYTVDEDRRQGFAYGTLPGHPESGEEAFVVTHGEDDQVTFTVRAFSRPATLLTRLGGPAGRLVQDLATRQYLRSLKRIANP